MRSTFFYSRSCSKSLAQSDQDEDVMRREPSAVIIASSRGWCLAEIIVRIFHTPMKNKPHL